MARTIGATNRTPRELEALAAFLKEKAKLKRKNEALKKENEALKKKKQK